MKKATFIEAIAAILTILFTYAAASKLLNFSLFTSQLSTHPYLDNVAGIIAWIVPLSELGIVALLASKSLRLLGLYSTVILLVIFTLYLGLMLLSGKHLPCSCGGVISSLSWQQHILFNCAFIIIAAIAIVGKRHIQKNREYKEIQGIG